MSQADATARAGVLPPSPRGGFGLACEGNAHRTAGGDAAGGLSPATSQQFATAIELDEASQEPAENAMNAAAAAAVAADSSIEGTESLLLHRAWQEAERLGSEQSYGGSQVLSEATRGPQSSIRVLCRVRPVLRDETDVGCLRILSKQQLEVFVEPRTSLAEQHSRHRRGTIAGMRDARDSRDMRDGPRTAMSVLAEGEIMTGAFAAPASAAAAAEAGAGGTFDWGTHDVRSFMFDELFDQDASDDTIFDAIRDDLTAAVNGEAVCILAYGATGSGKTHTVKHLAERAVQELEWRAATLANSGIRMEVDVQIVEVYNEQLRDLLAFDSATGTLGHAAEQPRLRLSVASGGSTLLGAVRRSFGTETHGGMARGLQEALRVGQAQRTTSATSVHGRSSRSHLVMVLFVTVSNAATGAICHTGKLSFVDLAGSERLKRSEAVGDRRREAQHINRSLSALVDVISAKERRVGHVPYRNSKLTQLLQDALGGQQQCRTVVIVALPPTCTNLNDTLHSLQFSSRLAALVFPNFVSVRRSCLRHGTAGSGDHGLTRGMSGSGGDLLASEDRAALRQELQKLQAEHERAKAQLQVYKGQLEQKSTRLEELVQKNAELLQSNRLFVQSRQQMLGGFVALDQKLQDVEATAFDIEGPTTSDVAPLPTAKAPVQKRLPTSPSKLRGNTRSGTALMGRHCLAPLLRASRSVGSEAYMRMTRPVAPQHRQPARNGIPSTAQRRCSPGAVLERFSKGGSSIATELAPSASASSECSMPTWADGMGPAELSAEESINDAATVSQHQPDTNNVAPVVACGGASYPRDCRTSHLLPHGCDDDGQHGSAPLASPCSPSSSSSSSSCSMSSSCSSSSSLGSSSCGLHHSPPHRQHHSSTACSPVRSPKPAVISPLQLESLRTRDAEGDKCYAAMERSRARRQPAVVASPGGSCTGPRIGRWSPPDDCSTPREYDIGAATTPSPLTVPCFVLTPRAQPPSWDEFGPVMFSAIGNGETTFDPLLSQGEAAGDMPLPSKRRCSPSPRTCIGEVAATRPHPPRSRPSGRQQPRSPSPRVHAPQSPAGPPNGHHCSPSPRGCGEEVAGVRPAVGYSSPRARRSHSPQAYAVEVISCERARQLAAEVQQPDSRPAAVAAAAMTTASGASPPMSPALLLRPDDEEHERAQTDSRTRYHGGICCGGAAGSSYEMPTATGEAPCLELVCCDSVSVSSDESAIRARLEQALELRPRPLSPEAAGHHAGCTSPRRQSHAPGAAGATRRGPASGAACVSNNIQRGRPVAGLAQAARVAGVRQSRSPPSRPTPRWSPPPKSPSSQSPPQHYRLGNSPEDNGRPLGVSRSPPSSRARPASGNTAGVGRYRVTGTCVVR